MVRPALFVASLMLVGVLTQASGALAITTPTLTAKASGSAPAGSSFPEDVAQLSGSAAATGTIVFRLYGRDDPTCAQAPIQTTDVTVDGDGTYDGNDFLSVSPGTYRFIASYSGDAQNAYVTTACNDPDQQFTVTQNRPRVIGTASSSVQAGGQMSDAARVLDGDGPTGSVRFDLYGPNDPACASAIATSTGTLDPFAFRASSAPYVATAPGLYRWVATYPGDANNAPAATTCGDSDQTVIVTSPTVNPAGDASVSLEAAPPTTAGSGFTVAARVMTAMRPNGTLTFRLYGPDDMTCSRGAVTALVTSVFGPGRYSSPPFSPASAGAYVVVASYVGEDGSTASTACGDPTGRVTVTPPDEADPEPEFEQSFTIERVDGRVFVGQTGASSRSVRALKFVEVREKREVPLGAVVDTRKGHAKLTTEVSRLTTQDGTFYGTTFKVRQPAGQGGLTELDIRDAAAVRSRCRAHGKRAAAAKRKSFPGKLIAKFKGKAKGRYRTRGRNSSASVKGTTWEVDERCDGTLTKVITGVVNVFDPRRGTTHVVRAGDSVLVRER